MSDKIKSKSLKSKKKHRNRSKGSDTNAGKETNEETAPTVRSELPESLEPICRICHDLVDPNKRGVVRPCRCRNYIHQRCYQEWFNTSKLEHCEICQTNYTFQTRSRLNKNKAKHNCCCLVDNLIFFVIVLLSTCLLYGLDLKYLGSTLPDFNFSWLQALGSYMAILGIWYLIDGLVFFDLEVIRDPNYIVDQLTYHSQNPWIGYLSIQIKMIPTSDNWGSYFLKSLFFGLFLIFIGAIVTVFSIKIYGAIVTRIIMVIAILGLSVLNFILIKFNSKHNKYIIILSIIIGQLIFHLIGLGILNLIDCKWRFWQHMVQHSVSIFTFAIGTMSIVIGLFVLFLIKQAIINVSNFFCPREPVPQLETYQDTL